jgi:taurine transport system ATP-binding protein
MMMAATPELEARALSVEYEGAERPLPALRNIDLAIAPGEFVAIVGPSGSGKTTLLNAFAGFVHPTTGEVLFRGAPIRAPSVERAVVFQRHALLPWLNVVENVAFPLKLRGIDRRTRREQVTPLLLTTGLIEFANRPVWALSGGMQQRVGLARALAADPSVLLLDEPLGALDAITREDLQQVLLDLWAASAKTAVLITHDIEEALFLGTRVAVLSARPGRIVASFATPFAREAARGASARSVRASAAFGEAKAEIRDLLARHAAPSGASVGVAA